MQASQLDVNNEFGLNSESVSKHRIQGWFIAISAVMGILSIIFLTMVFVSHETSLLILAASCLLTFIIGMFFISDLFSLPQWITIVLFTLMLEVTLSLLSAVFPSFSGIPYAAIALSLALIISSLLPRGGISEYFILFGIFGAIGSILVSLLAPLPKIENPMISGVAAAFALLFVVLVIIFFTNDTLVASLRTKLTIGAMAITLVPLLALSIINNRYLQNTIQNQSNQSLTVAAEQTSSSIDEFINSTLESLESESNLPSIRAYLDIALSSRANSIEESELATTFQSLQTKQKIYLPSYAILNLRGDILYDTDDENIGSSEAKTSYFLKTSSSDVKSVSPVEFMPNSREAYISFICPIKNESAATIGYLRAKYDARIFQNFVEKNTGLIGNRSYPILVDENGLRIADGYSPNQIYHSISQFSPDQYAKLLNSRRLPPYISSENVSIPLADLAEAVSKHDEIDYFTASLNINGKDILHSGTVIPLSSQPWSLIYFQDQANLKTAIESQNRLSSIISLIVAGIIGILITIIAHAYSAPIIKLTDTAKKVTSGDLDVQVKVTSNDEIGILGNAFNSMTQQLREFIDTLENRVRERTQQLAQQNESLQFRSKQLQTVSDVARNIVSTREVDMLLTTVTKLLSDRFGFYHAGIFLLDEKGEYAVLRAANSEGGQRMLARQHKLRVGQVGIVGYVTGAGEPRIATDVGEDAVFFNNPDLPNTKSEMALPLKVSSRVIGALDVQSTQSNAFSVEDIELFTTLADQIAVAIQNDQLYEETSKALEESQNLYRQYLKQEWTRQNNSGTNQNYKFTPDGLVLFDEELPEINMVLDTARPVFRSKKSTQNVNEIQSIMAVPIILGGESIGAIYLQESGESSYVWSQNELSTVQAVSEQVAQTLENARLFEQTIRRADRERKVLEITSKIRSTNDPQEMLKITLEELKRNLGVKQAQIVLNVNNQSVTELKNIELNSQSSITPNESQAAI